MNIWIFNHYASPPNLPGGTRHFDLARKLTKKGHKVLIFASAFKHHGGLKVEFDDSEKFKIKMIEDVRFVWIRTVRYNRNDWRRVMSMISFMMRSLRIGRCFRNINSNEPIPDVIIGSSVHLLAVLSAYFVAKKHKAKFIMEVRDLWPQTLVDMGALGDQNPIVLVLRSVERFLYRRADRIITLLPNADMYIVSHGGNPKKIVWIPNGVDLTRSPNPETTQKKNMFTAMYLGAHGKANALDVIIDTANIVQKKGFNDIRFILIGEGPEKSWLIRLASRFGLGNIEFLDPIEKYQVPRLLGTTDACIFNLEKTGVFKYGISSNKLFDYMAAAKPIVFSTNSSNNPVQYAKCGISVPPRDPEALSEAIIRLYGMSERERSEMGLRGKHYVEVHHNWNLLADRFEKMLRKLVL